MTEEQKALDRAAEKYVLGVEWKGDDYGARKSYYRDAFLAGHASRDAEVKALREKLEIAMTALRKCSAYNKPIGFDGHKGPDDDRYWYKQELLSRKYADDALAEIEAVANEEGRDG